MFKMTKPTVFEVERKRKENISILKTSAKEG